jgi:putative ABC transport system permease protein
VIYTQLDYIRNKDLGFEKEHVVVVQRAEKLGEQQEAFKQRLLMEPDVLHVTFTDSLPQMLIEAKVFQKEGQENRENNTLITVTSDYDFLETYGLQMVKGRFFKKEYSTDVSAVVLNEAAVEALDIKDPLEKRLIRVGGKPKSMHVIGVIKDFHMESLYTKIGPMAVILRELRPGVLLSVRLKPGNLRETMGSIEAEWDRFTNNQPFEYTFFPDEIDNLYKTEAQSGRMITTFSGLAVFIACLGLLGLASYTARKRTKEIGIRKVMGASVSGIVFLLNKDLIKRVIIANLLAWPAAYFVMTKWLQNFAYRINLSIWMFVGAAGLSLIVALLTVSFLSLKVAQENPVDSLRYE